MVGVSKKMTSGELEFGCLLTVDIPVLLKNVNGAYYYQDWQCWIDDLNFEIWLVNLPNKYQSEMKCWNCMEVVSVRFTRVVSCIFWLRMHCMPIRSCVKCTQCWLN